MFNIFVPFLIPPIRKKCPVLNGKQCELTGSSETIDLQKKLLRSASAATKLNFIDTG